MRIIQILDDKPDLKALKAVFDRHRREWLAQGHSGEWAIVTPSGAHSFHPTFDRAFTTAAHQLGDSDYLLQEVLVEDRVGEVLSVVG